MKRLLRSVISGLLDWFLPKPQHPTLAYPGLHLRWRMGWIRGWMKRPFWKFSELRGGTRVKIGKRFSLQGSLIFNGPGTVIFGDDVVVDAATTPYTHSSAAVIRIGSKTFVNGARFGCSKSIEIGDESILADCRLMDTDFHAVHKRRNEVGMGPDEAPIRIGKNVWVAAGAAVLKGVTIGDDSVIGFGAVVVKSVGAGKIAAGNPAKEITEIPSGPNQNL